jgi:hypothetical protein
MDPTPRGFNPESLLAGEFQVSSLKGGVADDVRRLWKELQV